MVVAIIGILSSIVLSAMREARLKAADAAILQEAQQLRNLMEQERSHTGSYAGIKNGGAWKPQSGCTGFTSSQFSTNASQVCQRLLNAVAPFCSSSCLYFQTTNPNTTERYSIMAYLPYQSLKAGAARFLCLGSSGNATTTSDGAAWTEDGCYQNP